MASLYQLKLFLPFYIPNKNSFMVSLFSEILLRTLLPTIKRCYCVIRFSTVK